MAYFPNGNRPYPTYAAAYPTNPITTPWPSPITTASNAFAQPNQNAPQPTRYPMAMNAYPQQAPALGANHWYSGPANAAAANNNPQSMVISLNAPKLSAEDIKKNFWLKVGATTISIVAGLGIATYFGMKILPQRIAAEMGHQFHKALLGNSSKEGVGEILNDIKNNTLTLDKSAQETLAKDWGHREAVELYDNKKDLQKFVADVTPHTSISRTGGLTLQDILRNTLTKDFMKELWVERIQIREQLACAINDLKELMLSEADQEKLVALARHHKNSTIEALMENKKFSALPPAAKAQVLQEVCKVLPLSDSLSLLLKDATTKTFDEPFKQEQLNSIMSTLKGQLVDDELLAEAKKSETVQAALQKLAPEASVAVQRQTVLDNISIQDALALVAQGSIDKTLAPEYMETKTQDVLSRMNESMKKAPLLTRYLSSFILPKASP
jgi:hypothetical protein